MAADWGTLSASVCLHTEYLPQAALSEKSVRLSSREKTEVTENFDKKFRAVQEDCSESKKMFSAAAAGVGGILQQNVMRAAAPHGTHPAGTPHRTQMSGRSPSISRFCRSKTLVRADARAVEGGAGVREILSCGCRSWWYPSAERHARRLPRWRRRTPGSAWPSPAARGWSRHRSCTWWSGPWPG